MYCIVCLKNRSPEFFCPYCLEKVKRLFSNRQIKVVDGVKKSFFALSLSQQKEIITLTHKRLGNLCKIKRANEFELNNIIREYIEMLLLNRKLEIPMDTTNGEPIRSYSQYKIPKKGNETI